MARPKKNANEDVKNLVKSDTEKVEDEGNESKEVKGTEEDTKDTETKKDVKPVAKKATKIDKDEEFSVISNVAGVMVFRSKTNDVYEEWGELGDEITMTYEEIGKMKMQAPRFFQDNWVIVLDNEEHTSQDVYHALKVEKYYQSNFIDPESIEGIFELPQKELTLEISKLSSGVKNNLATIAKNKIDEGEIDSINLIKNLQKLLKVDFCVLGEEDD